MPKYLAKLVELKGNYLVNQNALEFIRQVNELSVTGHFDEIKTADEAVELVETMEDGWEYNQDY